MVESQAGYSVLKHIDTPIEWVGKAVSWLILPLGLIMLGDISIREIRGYPTIWAWEMAYMLCGSIFILSAAYILRMGAISGLISFWNDLVRAPKQLLSCSSI